MIHKGLSYQNYAALEGWTSTDLRKIGNGFTMNHLGIPPKKPSEIGLLVHAIVLEPETVTEMFVAGPEGDWRSNAKKDEIKRLKEDWPNAIVMKPDVMTQAAQMAKMVLKRAGHLIESLAETEVVFTWDKYKCRVDGITHHEDLIELKTFGDARKHKWLQQVRNMGYHYQLAHHDQGMRAHEMEDIDWYHIVVETNPPYEVQVFDYANAVKERCSELWAASAARLEIMDPGDGYPGGIELVVEADLWRT